MKDIITNTQYSTHMASVKWKINVLKDIRIDVGKHAQHELYNDNLKKQIQNADSCEPLKVPHPYYGRHSYTSSTSEIIASGKFDIFIKNKYIVIKSNNYSFSTKGKINFEYIDDIIFDGNIEKVQNQQMIQYYNTFIDIDFYDNVNKYFKRLIKTSERLYKTMIYTELPMDLKNIIGEYMFDTYIIKDTMENKTICLGCGFWTSADGISCICYLRNISSIYKICKVMTNLFEMKVIT